MKRPWRRVISIEAPTTVVPLNLKVVAEPYRSTYRQAFVKKCEALGMIVKTDEEIDAAIETAQMLGNASSDLRRVFLTCGHFVDIRRSAWFPKKWKCHLCQSAARSERRRLVRRAPYAR